MFIDVNMLPTLKGVFPKPKTQHKRDFLLENKLRVKELQKNSSRIQLQKAEEHKLVELRRRQRHKSLDSRQFPSQRRPSTGCSCDCGKTVQTEVSCRSESIAPSNYMYRKVEMCNREVQTDDILDEDFLYQALNRCSSLDVRRHKEEIPHDTHRANNLPESKIDNQDNINNTNFNLDNLTLDTERLPATASSTQLSTKISTRRNHELGDRQDVRLPKYLEREKRIKELEKQREMDRDRNCPFGYKPLSEDERQRALDTAQRKFQTLIGELNRMPMTTETLRMRSRKVEIERELIELENDIRVFSKPKVYVKINSAF